jgi:hypothetical protein
MTDKLRVTVLRGLPGSGKSHVAGRREFVACGNDRPEQAVICSADDFFQEGPDYHFDPSKLTDAHRTCFRKFVDAVNDSVPYIIVDNTNIHAAEFSPYVIYAEAYGYEVEVITVWVPLEKAMARQVHKVPDSVMTRMYADLLNESVPPYFNHTVIPNS